MVHTAWGIIIASGRNEQLSEDVDVAFLSMGHRPVLSYSIDAMEKCDDIEGYAVVTRKDRMMTVKSLAEIMGATKLRRIVAGSSRRVSSVQAAVNALDEGVTLVCLHEVSRPFVTADQISDTIKTAKRYGCGLLATKIEQSVKVVPSGTKVSKSVNDGSLWIAESPQTYRIEILDKALQRGKSKRNDIFEESEMLDGTRDDVRVVANTGLSMKISSPELLNMACAVLNQEPE